MPNVASEAWRRVAPLRARPMIRPSRLRSLCPRSARARTHWPKQIQILGTQMPSPKDPGTRGRDAPVEELKVINVARVPARFRAFPDDTGIALKGDKPIACVGPILKLLDDHVIAGLAAGAAGEECPWDI